jgi:pectin methylesterase-like acyl-CoA thioesterase
MSRHVGWFSLTVVMLAVSSPLQALNYEVGGCKTGSGYVNFATISAAVAGVPAGSTILVCPGVYPEQVTITQPLTLQGIRSDNSNRAVITINPNGNLAPNVTSVIGEYLFAQVLVQNVNPPGSVNIIGITVDGTNGPQQGCTDANGFAGVFYASGTTGTVNEVTARNQIGGCGLGAGIWVENGAGPTLAITVENSSVRNMDGAWHPQCQRPNSGDDYGDHQREFRDQR